MSLQPGPSTPRRVPSRPAPTPRGVSASVGAPTAASAGCYGPSIHGRPSGGRRPSGRYPRRYVARATKLTVIDELDRRKDSLSLTYNDLSDIRSIDSEVDERTPLIQVARQLRDGLDQILGVPVDKFKGVAASFLYLGMCSMLPWNFLISITSFWNYKFRATNDTGGLVPVPYYVNNVTNTNYFVINSFFPQFRDIVPTPIVKPTEMQLSFPSYVAIASNIPGAITTLSHSLYGQRVGVSTRMVWSLTLLLTAFVCLLALSIPNSDRWQMQFLHVVLMLVVLSNVGVNVLQGSLFGVSGRFPNIYAGCVMMGQALGGVLPAVGAILMTSIDVSPKLLGPASFSIILGLLCLAVACHRFLSNNKFFLYFAEGKANRITGDTSDHDAQAEKVCYKDVFKRAWIYFVGGWLTYGSTLSIFPALTSLVQSTRDTPWTEKYFTPVACILVFNLSDLSGRILATYLQWPGRSSRGQWTFFAIVLLRLSLIPICMLCNAAPTARKLPVIFDSDTVFIALIVLLGSSVGYIGNLALIQAPKTSEMAESQEATSLILTSFFVLGQASGSFGSYFILKSI